jgi:hypothetical protein
MMKSLVLGTVLGSMASMVSLAEAADPEPSPVVVAPSPAAPQMGSGAIAVRLAPGVDLPVQVALDVRAAIRDALAGRAAPAAMIEVTLEAGGALVRVGTLWRRIAVTQWDEVALRTVALHVVDLAQPAPEVPAPPPPPAPVAAEPAANVVTEAPAAEPAAASGEVWSVRASFGGARGIEHTDPWLASFGAGAMWSRDWMQAGLEVGWDHAAVRHPNGLVEVNYDAIPARVVLAAQNGSVEAGVRLGAQVYRLTGEHPSNAFSLLGGVFLGLKVPIGGRFRGFLVGGIDAFSRRAVLTDGYTDQYTTPRFTPYAGLVVEAAVRP